MTRAIACAALLALAACSAPLDERVERLVRICEKSGLFRAVGGIAVPLVFPPASVVFSGADIVCANPERFAGDSGTLAWLARNLREAR